MTHIFRDVISFLTYSYHLQGQTVRKIDSMKKPMEINIDLEFYVIKILK